MCGLVGVINKSQNGFSKDQQEIFSTLLMVDFLRGPDSTGSFLITNAGDVSLMKEASDPMAFMRTKEYSEIMTKAWSRGSAMIGHNRKATRGVVNDANAHPFVVDDNIVLVHNGTMYGDHKKIADVEVDSHAIAHAIHEKGTVTEALSSFDAAYALIWYDFGKGTLNLIRNKDRPLWWMETHSSWIWASEKCMLDFVASRMNLHVKDGPTELPEDTLQTYTLEGKTWAVSDEKLNITKPVKTYATQQWSGHGAQQQQTHYPTRIGNQRRHAYDAGWGNGDDAPFVPTTHTPPVRLGEMNGGSQTAGRIVYEHWDKPGTVPHFERKLAIKNNKLVTNEQYYAETLENYPQDKKLICETFDYTYVNQKDDTDGYYLYASVCDDPDIIVRQEFLKKYMNEERILQIASGGYIYEFVVDRKRWSAYAPGAVVPRSVGFVVIESKQATLLYGGGVGNEKYSPKAHQTQH